MGNALDKITIKGFKSIKSLEDFELKNLNILIGGNGAGKSNFVDAFRFLRAMADGNLNTFVKIGGGADDFLFNGPKTTKCIEMDLKNNDVELSRRWYPTVNEALVVETEGLSGKDELTADIDIVTSLNELARRLTSGFTVYHFHDTSSTSPMRRSEITADNARLRPNAPNIAPFLLELRTNNIESYSNIVESIKLVTPFFDDFILKPQKKGEKETVNLSWRQKGSDYPMQPYHFSDGTIRFICLATALLQPVPPSTIVIDEPELGLHPYAIEILAELIQAAAQKTQVIISTQSPHLIDKFKP